MKDDTMKPILILNDVHIGASRVAGTTMASAAALKEYIQVEFLRTICKYKDNDLLIDGDLLDGFTIEGRELITVYRSLSSWLLISGNTLHLVPGNHDWSAKGDKLSSFHFLCEVLRSQFGNRVVVYGPEFSKVRDGVYVIPHCPNQDLLELELEKAMACDDQGVLLLHLNIMNPFADKSDHSLNLTEEWCQRLTGKYKLIVAHEHQRRFINMGKGIHVLGNQFPSSVADCLSLAQQRGEKFAHILEGETLTPILTWSANDDIEGFMEVEWQNLPDLTNEVGFIRVVGHATHEQAAEVITTISKFRSKSAAYVVTNAVVVEGVNNMGELAEASLEQIQTFNVLGALLELLEPAEQKVIKALLE